MEKLTATKRMEEYKNSLEMAQRIYEKNKNNIIFGQIVKRQDVSNWESAFFSK